LRAAIEGPRSGRKSEPDTKYYQIKEMKRVDLYIKVEVELDDEETPEKVAREICRQVEKIYVVRKAELSNAVARD
jgi:hypothetical protein